MSESKKHRFLSGKEVRYFDALARFDTYVAAAKFLGIAASTLYNWHVNLKKRYRKKRGWINSVLAQTRRGGLLSDFLTEKTQMAPPGDVELDDEEF